LVATITTTEGAVLGLLAASGERSGYDLSRLAERSITFLWTPSQSQIYKVLPRLAAAGLASVREIEQRRRPDKALYRITSSGLDALRAWLETVDDEPAGGPVVFALKLFFCELASPGTALAQLAAYRAFLSQRLDAYMELEAQARESPTSYRKHVLNHGLTRVRATLDWIDTTAAAIQSQPTHARRTPDAPRR
jgi:DNA-binding PadR family transcriptional regulator